MNEKQLWEYFFDKQISKAKLLDRDLLWVSKEDFEKVQHLFVVENTNLFHKGESFRSHSYILHIHAVKQGNYVLVHKDIGNMAKFFPLGILHLLFDVIPYSIFSLFKRKSLRTMFTYPPEDAV